MLPEGAHRFRTDQSGRNMSGALVLAGVGADIGRIVAAQYGNEGEVPIPLHSAHNLPGHHVVVKIGCIQLRCGSILFQNCRTFDPFRRLSCLVESRKQHRSKNCKDCNYNKKFNKGEIIEPPAFPSGEGNFLPAGSGSRKRRIRGADSFFHPTSFGSFPIVPLSEKETDIPIPSSDRRTWPPNRRQPVRPFPGRDRCG